MISDKQIRTLIPFITAFVAVFFVSGADILETFGDRLTMLQGNEKLMWLLTSGNVLVAIPCLIASIVFFTAWKKNKQKNMWYCDLFWQIAGAFFCFFLISVISLIGYFKLYLWITGLLWAYSGIFIFYMMNTVVSARSLLYNPPTPDEMLKQAQAFEDLKKTIEEVSKK